MPIDIAATPCPASTQSSAPLLDTLPVLSRQAQALAFAIAVASYWVFALAWPLYQGRDVASYLTYFLEFLSPDPYDRYGMIYRTPLAPFINGVPLALGGPLALEATLSILFAISSLLYLKLFSAVSWSMRWWLWALLMLYPG